MTRDGVKIAHVRLLSFTSGAHGELREEIDKLLDRGAEGIVLDLRGNGGGLLREAVLVSSIFIEDGEIVSTKGRRRPERKFEAEGDAIDEDIPVVVLVDRGSASASEIVTGALRDTKRGDDRRRAHVRQGRLPGGRAALERRRARPDRGQLLPAERREHLGRRASSPRSRRATSRGRGGTRRCRSRSTSWSRRSSDRRPSGRRRIDRPVVCVLVKHGRFLTATPLFQRGGRITIAAKDAGRRAAGLDGARRRRQARAARGPRRSATPRRARDVVEALMVDRGLRRSFPRAVEEDARAERRSPPSARDLTDLPTFTIDPADGARLRRRDLRPARGRPRPAVGPHRRRERLRAAGHGARRRGLPARHERLRPGRGRADAAARRSRTRPAASCRTRTATP